MLPGGIKKKRYYSQSHSFSIQGVLSKQYACLKTVSYYNNAFGSDCSDRPLCKTFTAIWKKRIPLKYRISPHKPMPKRRRVLRNRHTIRLCATILPHNCATSGRFRFARNTARGCIIFIRAPNTRKVCTACARPRLTAPECLIGRFCSAWPILMNYWATMCISTEFPIMWNSPCRCC